MARPPEIFHATCGHCHEPVTKTGSEDWVHEDGTPACKEAV